MLLVASNIITFEFYFQTGMNKKTTNNNIEVQQILEDAKALAIRYKNLTGKPLGITGEIGEFTASILLDIELSAARQAGYDGIRNSAEKIQIKSRCADKLTGHRVGKISDEHEFDYLVFVWLDEQFEPKAIYEAHREDVLSELNKPGSTARNVRGQLSARKLISISKEVWKAEL